MAGSVKNKIRLGTVFLFSLVMLSGIISVFYLSNLRNDSRNILKANYESIEYGHKMQASLDGFNQDTSAALDTFNKYLIKQNNNISEPGEARATEDLTFDFSKFRQGDTSALLKSRIRNELQKILYMNMVAIRLKNEKAEKSAEDGMKLLITVIAFILIVGFTFAVNFPSVITSPIRKLTEAIRGIAQKNYSQRVHIDSKDEFGQLADSFNNMAERLEYFENSNLNKILFEKSRAEAVINSLKDASIGIDKEDRVLFANKQAIQLLGLRSNELVGRKAEDIAGVNDLFRFLLADEFTTPFKIVVDGRENYFTKETVEVEDENSAGRIITIRNITTFKELDVAKTNFIATISHELKTPLASSDFSLKLLEDERVSQLSPQQKELVENIKMDNQRILKILSELLNMSQVEAGRMQLQIEEVQAELIVQKALDTVKASATEKNIMIEVNISEHLPPFKADAEKTTWVLNNFLTNAIKFSPGGSRILVNIHSEENGIRFSVRDFGPGIPSEFHNKIFDRYFQVPGSKSKGTGLGLSISKEFIEAQHGTIAVTPAEGGGIEFSFFLSK